MNTVFTISIALLFSGMLVSLSGCSDSFDSSTPTRTAQAQIVDASSATSEEENRLRLELATAKQSATETAERLLNDEREFRRLENKNLLLAKQLEVAKSENLDLANQLATVMKLKVKYMEKCLLLHKEAFALMSKSDQNRLLQDLDDLNTGKSISLVGIQALVNAGMIEDDDPRYLKAKESGE